MYNEILDKYINGSTIKKVGPTYFIDNWFKVLHNISIRDDFQYISLHLWVRFNDDYAVRIASLSSLCEIYFLRWNGDSQDFCNVINENDIKSVKDVDRAIYLLLDSFLFCECLKVKYDLK